MNTADFPATAWRTSSYSGDTTNCVEVAFATTTVGVRDTKQRDGGVLVIGGDAWASFQEHVRAL